MVHILNPFLLALQFLTRIPVPRVTEFSDQDLGRSVLWFPVVGLLIGLLLVLLRLFFIDTDPLVQAALLLIIWTLLTGALHLDGLADSADAWLGGHGDRDKTLKLMKESTSGAGALVVVNLVLILKFSALAALAQTFPMWPALLIIPMLARAAVIALFITTPYVRPKGVGARHAQHMPHKTGVIVLIAAALVALLFLGFKAFGVLLVMGVIGFLLRQMMYQRIGGTTGDTCGAMIEILEAAALAGLVWAGS